MQRLVENELTRRPVIDPVPEIQRQKSTRLLNVHAEPTWRLEVFIKKKKRSFPSSVLSTCSEDPKLENKTAFVCRSFVVQPFVEASITGKCGVQCPVATRKATLDVPGQ